MRKYLRTLLLLGAFYLVFAVVFKMPSMISAMIALVVIMMPMAVFSYDDSAKWDVYGLTLPVNRQQIVLSRYVLTVLFAAVGWAFSALVTMLYDVIQKNTANLGEDLLATLLVCGISLLAVSVMLPVIYKFGVEKGRFAIIGLIIVCCIGCFLLSKLTLPFTMDQMMLVLMKLMPVLVVVALLLSFFISYQIYDKKEF